jgi:hypothetical protein
MPTRKPRTSKPRRRPAKPDVQTLPALSHTDASHALSTQHLFWNNVVREMLTGLSVARDKHPELFDGRFAVLTNHGERISIAAITPLFAMSVPATPGDRENSQVVQCTVFRIATPDGEVFTLPLHEIRGMHSITPELLEQLHAARQAAEAEEEIDPARPFGLAAFAALPKPGPSDPAPTHPTE